MEEKWRWLSPAEPGWCRGTARYRDWIRAMAMPDISTHRDPAEYAVLRALDGAWRFRSVIDYEIMLLVAEARARGITWELIGEALGGIRKQSVQQKYRKGLSAAEVEDMDADLEDALEWARQAHSDPTVDATDQAEAVAILDRFG